MKGKYMNHDNNPLKVNRICPLCEEHKATYLPTMFGSKGEYNCPQCKTFSISAGIEDRIINLPKYFKEQLSSKAIDTPQKMILYIYIVNDKIDFKYLPINSLNQR